jgi:cysteine-rich repeat protein
MHDFRRTLKLHPWAPLGAALLLLMLGIQPAFADGTEELGTPTIAIAEGSGFVAAGVGLSRLGDDQPGTISINVPGTVQQALLYWEGANQTAADFTLFMDITVNGILVTGESIGGNTQYSGGFVTVSYRAEITSLVSSGDNNLVIDGLDFTQVNDGAGVLVIFDDGSTSEIEVRDGSDYAFRSDLPGDSLRITEPQTFYFTPSAVDRTAALSLFFGAVAGTVSGAGDERPTTIEITVAGVTTELINTLNSVNGEEWDTVNVDVPIPAGETSLTVQAFSDDRDATGNLPASLVWVTAGLSVASAPFCGDGVVDPGEECDDGNNIDGDGCSANCELEGGGEGCTPGYWKQGHHFVSYPAPLTPYTLFSSVFENAFPGKTLVEVLDQGGGGLYALGRHTVAALLNAQSKQVSYDLLPSEVVEWFNDVYPSDKDTYESLKDDVFERFNEQFCPLNGGAEQPCDRGQCDGGPGNGDWQPPYGPGEGGQGPGNGDWQPPYGVAQGDQWTTKDQGDAADKPTKAEKKAAKKAAKAEKKAAKKAAKAEKKAAKAEKKAAKKAAKAEKKAAKG